ncbi:chemotaxis protein CheV [Candidatus Woesearchaeota archaeon]|nr:chemotaxis protein CheV [Candidatus Woesearchaeota archaeon]
MEKKEDKQEILLETGTNELEVAEFGIIQKNQKNMVQTFGINVAKIREIIKIPKYISIPNTNQYVMGIFKLRDQIIPLINLAGWLNEETEDIDFLKCYVIITEFNQQNFGFLIHDVRTIHRMSWERVLSPMDITHNIQNESITGIVTFDDRIMLMLDFEKIVADISPELSLSVETDKKVIEDVQHIGQGKQKVLLAEDSGIVRDTLAKMLEKGGFEVVHVSNGKDAWEYLAAFLDEAKQKNGIVNDVIQLVIADIEMPQMDGHSLCRSIKEHAELKTLPVVLFSSLIYEEIKRKGELIGADAQISKPEIGNLLTIIRDILRKKQEELKNRQ